MRITHVSLSPTEAAKSAARPALTPELLAAVGARYSRSNDGLEAILAKIDPENPDKSVDSIFKFVDYGHASIADMAPVALFIDDISMWLAYELFRLSPTSGGQESSTRYIRLDESGLLEPEALGLPDAAGWREHMCAALSAYEEAVAFWEGVATREPERVRIPAGTPPKAVARMHRNFAFDRARYFLPVAMRTNAMLVQSARAWVGVCQSLLSSPLPEARHCGELIREELNLVAPRLLKHARPLPSLEQGLARELALASSSELALSATERAAVATLDVFAPGGVDIAADLAFHDNRYSYVGEGLKRTAVRFAWDAVAFAEIRDLNRHRTGTKYCPPVPVGFYGALDQGGPESLYIVGQEATGRARKQLQAGDPTFVYELLLGTQFPFEHTTTADKFLYEAELRTGVGAHYRYAQHLKDALALWYEKYPETRGLVLEGSAEPE
ncbi:MAG: FAD-dependent thymidylate synthase [Armatimonas sp.]